MYSKMEIKFKRDTSFRKQFFVPESFAHPAKMDAQLLIWIVERYTKPGEVILDSMAGSGTMMLACTLGRNVVLVELEEKFCKMCADNWEQVRMRPQLGSLMGNCQIIQGDARQLEGLVDKIVSSPPYAEAQLGGGIAKKGYQGPKHGPTDLVGKRSYMSENIGSEDNISNLPYGQIDKIVTSPPYESGGHHADQTGSWGGQAQSLTKEQANYGQSQGQIGNLKSDSYLEAMLQVYQQCYKVLKPEGLMILVTKNFIRNKQVIRLDTDTIKLCEQAGFSFVERHYRKLTSQSFWRTIYHQKYPGVEKIEHEDVLVFRK